MLGRLDRSRRSADSFSEQRQVLELISAHLRTEISFNEIYKAAFDALKKKIVISVDSSLSVHAYFENTPWPKSF